MFCSFLSLDPPYVLLSCRNQNKVGFLPKAMAIATTNNLIIASFEVDSLTQTSF
jgi:hypothetical protein